MIMDKLNKNTKEQLNSDNCFEKSNEFLKDKKKVPFKKFQEEETSVKEDMSPSMKSFRKIVGSIVLVYFVCTFFLFNGNNKSNYMSNLESGKIENVSKGDILSKEQVKLEPKDISIKVGSGLGKIELSIWNFSQIEDGDYVQVFVDGAPYSEPFTILHRSREISVPKDAVIEVRGIRDGSNNGITYGLFLNETGETYLNTVPLNATNSYTLMS